MSEYTDTVLLECNRKSSPEYQSGNLSNPSTWTNKLGSGIKLNIGDKVLMKGAYVSAVGNEAATIEIRGRGAENNLVVGQEYSSSDTVRVKTMNSPEIGNTLYTYTPTTVKSQITDDKIALTHSYYKTTNGEFYITLPRTCATDDINIPFNKSYENWTDYNSASNGSCSAPNPYRLASDYSEISYFGEAGGLPSKEIAYTASTGVGVGGITNASQAQRTEIANDGSRHTLFVRDVLPNGSLSSAEETVTKYALHGHIDPALFTFNWYKKTYDYKIETGFNSPLNVAQSFTDQMSNIISTKVDRFINPALSGISGNDNFNMVAESRTNEAMPCSFGSGVQRSNSHTYFRGRNSHIAQSLPEKVTFKILGNGNIGDSPNPSNGYVIGPQTLPDATRKKSYDDTLFNMVIISPARLAGYRVIHKSTFTDTNNVPTEIYYYIWFDRNDLNIDASVEQEITLSYWRKDEQQMYDYEACYATVGYKRPEIQETGRFVAEEIGFQGYDRGLNTIDGGFKLQTDAYYPLSSSLNTRQNVLHLAIEWTDENLLLLKKFFDAQGRYTDLFDYDQMSPSQQELLGSLGKENFNFNKPNLRYIHMNASMNGSYTGNCQNVNPLGLETATVSYTAGNNYVVFNSFATSGVLTIGMCIMPNTDFESDWSSKNGKRTYITGIETLLGAETVSLSEPVKITGTSPVIFTNAKVGSDLYFSNNQAIEYIGTRTFSAGALYFDYNTSRADLNEGDGTYENEYDTLRYGFGVKVLRSLSPLKYDIGLFFGNMGMAETWFDSTGSKIQSADSSASDTFRCLGFDQHFNAFGTSALMLTNGKCGREGQAFYENGSAITGYKTWQNRNIPAGAQMDSKVNWWTGIDWTAFETDFMNNEIYIGANDPALEFNAQQSRFEFSRLHTAEVVGTSASLNSASSNTPVGDETTISYKLNKRLSRLNYSPNFIPYNNTLMASGTASDTFDHIVLDRNIIPYTIMDATSGITLEDYGCDERNWNKSLWDTLGFTYEQFHQTTDNRLARFNNLPIKTSTPTTNALVESSNLRLWYRQNGVPIYEPENIITPTVIGGKAKFDATRFTKNPQTDPTGVNYAISGLQDFSPVVQSCSSTTILASNLPRKMASPIYLVKTDLISPDYIGGPEGSSKLPVIAVVPKNSGYGDYYFGENFTEFTITAPKTVVDITTSIIDADGKDARVDDASCVVYQITKAHQSNAIVMEEILNPPKK